MWLSRVLCVGVLVGCWVGNLGVVLCGWVGCWVVG